ncbi:MAG: hypothetical protein K2N01_06470 [Lachnospiraceae bacterium]|nr:hypothetical protein [Lachnospiraceae bacterium]
MHIDKAAGECSTLCIFGRKLAYELFGIVCIAVTAYIITVMPFCCVMIVGKDEGR